MKKTLKLSALFLYQNPNLEPIASRIPTSEDLTILSYLSVEIKIFMIIFFRLMLLFQINKLFYNFDYCYFIVES